MRRCPSYVSLVLSLAVLPPATKAAELPDVTCARVEVRRLEDASSSGSSSDLKVTLTNRCGKDITAVDLEYRATSGRSAHISVDWLARLANSQRSAEYDIVRDKKSTEWTEAGPQSTPTDTVSATVKCILFADRTAIGDEGRIGGMFESRRKQVPWWEEHVELLKLLPEYYAAGTLLDSLNANPSKRGALDMKSFVIELKNAWLHTTPDSWPKLVQRRIAYYRQLISVHQEHAERVLY